MMSWVMMDIWVRVDVGVVSNLGHGQISQGVQEGMYNYANYLCK